MPGNLARSRCADPPGHSRATGGSLVPDAFEAFAAAVLSHGGVAS